MLTHEELVEEGKVKGKVAIETHEVKGTPMVVMRQENEYWGCIGKYRLTERMDSKQGVIDEITEMSWNNIIKMIMIVGDMNININELNKE